MLRVENSIAWPNPLQAGKKEAATTDLLHGIELSHASCQNVQTCQLEQNPILHSNGLVLLIPGSTNRLGRLCTGATSRDSFLHNFTEALLFVGDLGGGGNCFSGRPVA